MKSVLTTIAGVILGILPVIIVIIISWCKLVFDTAGLN